MSSKDMILRTDALTKHFGGVGFLKKSPVVQAVDGISLEVKRGETFAIVGESGCGKSTLARLLMRLLEPTSGEVVFDGKDISHAAGPDLTRLRRDMQFIFQDPFSSLNPRMTVGKLIAEPLEVHAPELSAAERRAKVADIMQKVGLPAEHAGRYPHEFSGGQRQRIGIARALITGPKLVIGDEPVSALDVSVQAQVINLLGDLSRELGVTLVVIAHDLGVIRHMSDRVAVMYLGRIVEMGTAEEVFSAPHHPYTQALLASIPAPRPEGEDRMTTLTGEMPSPAAPPPGCRFHTRCPFARPDCKTTVPDLSAVEGASHQVACHHWQEIDAPAGAPQQAPHSAAAEERFALYRAAIEGAKVTPLTPE
ncbi:peptide ABC transporter ATPase [Phaeobacter gallaeciensis]|uniref:Peptide ABC transporter ATPase n=2 Tax=Phaeobacter gallaeciensis TaxID=60890 RepID=A0A1B0ZSF4_9RHOB|nr:MULTISPECIES: dipeptide ABC transporter ATP-binding protein [Phaeobacter]ANP37054.1 peptide ABC transporter ATPase [Phaeobacter gallaeciensis]MDE4061049.1 dipeptide ABC transporter ATP-binding protein [Phaeobacter gallaeciensis]MDE4124158.1 dipeptide ABC transporter ATP-binding protein [Phaeobacter gallaeciensis]MDE4128628.1 dipeptide ABC transporter ATP-binding protein [Phaeobacter gallaeciensis]MDE4305003.1 dipeptide ABC transporter ATP-binding protein [Phaeobacter gallaeciensis]